MSDHFAFALQFVCLLNLVILLETNFTNIAAKHNFLLSVTLSKELLNGQGWFVVKMLKEQFESTFNKAVVGFGVQIKTIVYAELLDVRGEN